MSDETFEAGLIRAPAPAGTSCTDWAGETHQRARAAMAKAVALLTQAAKAEPLLHSPGIARRGTPSDPPPNPAAETAGANVAPVVAPLAQPAADNDLDAISQSAPAAVSATPSPNAPGTEPGPRVEADETAAVARAFREGATVTANSEDRTLPLPRAEPFAGNRFAGVEIVPRASGCVEDRPLHRRAETHDPNAASAVKHTTTAGCLFDHGLEAHVEIRTVASGHVSPETGGARAAADSGGQSPSVARFLNALRGRSL